MALPQEIEATNIRRPLAEAMEFEILVNEENRVWVFHDKAIPGRLAWIEYDSAAGMLEFIPHHMTDGILYAEVPPALRTRIGSADTAYLYLIDGNEVKSFQKVPLQTRKH